MNILQHKSFVQRAGQIRDQNLPVVDTVKQIEYREDADSMQEKQQGEIIKKG